jgi:hypothetical protein
MNEVASRLRISGSNYWGTGCIIPCRLFFARKIGNAISGPASRKRINVISSPFIKYVNESLPLR